MATTPKKSIDVLLINHDSGKPYIELTPDYRSDGGASETRIKSALDFAKRNLEANTTEPQEGIEYQTTRAGTVAILWIEIEDSDAAILKDGQAWLDQIGKDWAAANTGWTKQKDSNRQGYTGFSINKKG